VLNLGGLGSHGASCFTPFTQYIYHLLWKNFAETQNKALRFSKLVARFLIDNNQKGGANDYWETGAAG
jgi:hypothetical protein